MSGLGVPANVDLEMCVIAGAMLDPDRLADIRFLRADDFFRDSHARTWRVIQRLSDAGRPIDSLTVLDECAGDGKAMRLEDFEAAFSRTPHSANLPEHAAIVRLRAMQRRLMQRAGEALALASDQSTPVQETIAAIQRLAFDVEDFGGQSIKPFREQLTEARERIHARSEAAAIGLPFGLRDMDEFLGGMTAGQLIVIAARPGSGKSALLGTVAHHAATMGQRSYIASLEMEGVEWASRLLQSESRVNVAAIRPDNYTQEDQDKLNAAYNAAVTLQDRLVVDDAPIRTVNDIAATARREKAKRGLAMIGVDYLQLVDSRHDVGKDSSRQEQVAYVSRRLKAIAKECGVPVLALSQLNRQSEARADKRPCLADLRESGQIEQDADVVMLLHRPFLGDPNADPLLAECNVVKNRNGATPLVKLQFTPCLTRFDDYNPPKFGNPTGDEW